jgi:hypothetical protein
MFFHIGVSAQENFPKHWWLGNFCLSTDSGWHYTTVGNFQAVYKGYADQAPLQQLLETVLNDVHPTHTGNFCVIAYDTKKQILSIHTDIYRSFPIYFDQNRCVNNLIPLINTAWTDSLISIDAGLGVHEEKFDVIGNTDWVVSDNFDQIDQLLSNKILCFLEHNQLPLRVFLSGGVDTLLIYSYIRKFSAQHELVKSFHVDLDWFWLSNSADITRNWGYRQIHHWQQPCVLSSGAPGDEFMLRSPTTANEYLLYHGSNVLDLLSHDADCFHRDYFLQPKHQSLFKEQIKNHVPAQTQEQLLWKLCNTVVNDWQHWHIGHTLTWTPLRDLRLFKLFLTLPYQHAEQQILNSSVSCALIEKNVPGLTSLLSDSKNTGNYMKNLRELLTGQ